MFKNNLFASLNINMNENSKFKHVFTGSGLSKMSFFWKTHKDNYLFFGKDYDKKGLKNFLKLGWKREKKNSDTKVKK